MRLELASMLVVLLSCAFAITSGSAQGTPITMDDDRSKQVDEYVERQMKMRQIPGLSLAVVRDGKVIKVQGYGLANVENSVPATPETAFLLASVTKQFT